MAEPPSRDNEIARTNASNGSPGVVSSFCDFLALAGYVGLSIPKGIDWIAATAKRDAEQAAKAAVERYMKEPTTRDLLRSTIKERATEIVTVEATSIAVQEANEVLREVRHLRQQLAQQLKDPRLAPGTPAEAFAYYGRQDAKGKWVVGPYFKPQRGNRKALPQARDRIDALGYVFAHTDYVQFTSDHRWVSAPLSSPGVIHPGDELEVREGKNVHDGNYWIKFTFVKRASN